MVLEDAGGCGDMVWWFWAMLFFLDEGELFLSEKKGKNEHSKERD